MFLESSDNERKNRIDFVFWFLLIYREEQRLKHEQVERKKEIK